MAEDIGNALILTVNSLVESWILDSGALYHCTSYYKIMENYISGDFGKVDLADVETLKITRKNDIQVRLPNMWKFKDVICIPSFKNKNKKSLWINLIRSGWKINKGAMVIAHGKKNGPLYVTSRMENIVEVVESNEK